MYIRTENSDEIGSATAVTNNDGIFITGAGARALLQVLHACVCKHNLVVIRTFNIINYTVMTNSCVIIVSYRVE